MSLGAVTLSGSENYSGRNVALNVTVDDVDAAALGVVSQGELFSLALALFLPRATSKHSPFNFIVIDDPVQSMDPRKVEGLARLLEKVAETHQIVAFTHDTRLADMVRYHRIKATIREVRRSRRSKVTVADAEDPVKRELAAARELVKDNRITPDVLGEILPGQCRLALEAALLESAHRTLLSTSLTHTVIQERVAKARQLTELAALALFGERREKGEVYDELKRRIGEHETSVIRLCNSGAYMPLSWMPHAPKRSSPAPPRPRRSCVSYDRQPPQRRIVTYDERTAYSCSDGTDRLWSRTTKAHPRAAVFLIRRALEEHLDAYVRRNRPALERCSMRDQDALARPVHRLGARRSAGRRVAQPQLAPATTSSMRWHRRPQRS